MEKVVVLNYDYTFLNVVTPAKAFSYIARGKVIVEKVADKVLTTAEESFKIPVVVRFAYMIRQVYKRRVPWSKKNICIRDNYTCGYCGIYDKNRMTVDHVTPKALGGKNTFENCVASCKKCNNRKGDKTCKEAGMFPTHRLIQPTISEFMKQWYKQFNVEAIIKSIWE